MKYTKDNPLRVCTTFSGYDSQCLALDRLKQMNPEFDYELVAWSEIDKYAIMAHNAIYPQWADRNFGDISKIDWSQVPDFDLLTYSSPCVTGDTMVETQLGAIPMKKLVENWEAGKEMFVNCMNTYFVVVGKKVTNAALTRKHADIVLLSFENGSKLKCTPDHRIAIYDGTSISYKEARHLKKSDKIITRYGDTTLQYIEVCAPEDVYDITVKDNHNFFGNGILIHNCQDFSNAGLQRGGEKGSGTRSSLLWYVEEAIKEKHPKYLLMENVAALVGSKFINTFNAWRALLDSYGYTSYAQVLNSKDYGVPQNRDRIFLVSILGEENPYYFPKPFPLEKCLKDVLEENVDECYYLSEKAIEGFIAHNENHEKKETGFI